MAAASALRRHGVRRRTSGGGSIFNSPVLASIASLRGDNPGPATTTPGGWLHLLADRTFGGRRRTNAAVLRTEATALRGLFCGRVGMSPCTSLRSLTWGY